MHNKWIFRIIMIMDILILSLAMCRAFSNIGSNSQAEEFGKQIDGKTIVNIENNGIAFLTHYKVTYADQNGIKTTTILDPAITRIKTETSTDDQYHVVINNDIIVLCVPRAELAHNSQYKSQ